MAVEDRADTDCSRKADDHLEVDQTSVVVEAVAVEVPVRTVPVGEEGVAGEEAHLPGL